MSCRHPTLPLRSDAHLYCAALAAASLQLIAGALVCAASAVSPANVKLAWDPPVADAGGTALTDIAGYKLYRGAAPGSYSDVRDVGLATTATVSNLQAGATHFFAVTAYDAAGRESAFSSQVAWSAPLVKPLHHFTWAPIANPQTAGRPFGVTVTARDANANLVADFVGAVRVSGIGRQAAVIGAGRQTFAFPLRTSADETRSQVIYLTNEVGQAGWIDALALDVSRVPPQGLTSWTIRLKQTAASSYTNGSPWEATGWTTVYRKDETLSSTDWVEFVFSTPFYYSARSNLVVDFSFRNTNHTASGYCRYTTATGYRHLAASVGQSYGDPLTWSAARPTPSRYREIPDIRLRIARAIAVVPASSPAFASGTWTGFITVPDAADSVTLTADDGAGHTGVSGAFDVMLPAAPYALTMAAATGGPTSSDADGDGVADWAEVAAGTDPYDALSLLAMDAPLPRAAADPPGVVVQWLSSTARFYVLQRSTDLRAVPPFTDLAAHLAGQDPVTVYTDTTATATGPYYYRVRLEP